MHNFLKHANFKLISQILLKSPLEKIKIFKTYCKNSTFQLVCFEYPNKNSNVLRLPPFISLKYILFIACNRVIFLFYISEYTLKK